MAAKKKAKKVASKAWETRRANAEKKRRQEIAKKGWETRRRNMAIA